ncbi:hypothetical protein GOBAR_DD32627 [Gossypium barbadense]|nr:hypothetical protein GOBAR_DD32627 [Gossypium barbadense]
MENKFNQGGLVAHIPPPSGYFVQLENPDGHQKNSKVVSPIKPEERKSSSLIEVPALSLEELKEKTDNFGSNALIGEGSYGRVYYANLNDGKTVADAEQCQLLYTLSQSLRSAGSSENIDTVKDLLGNE